MWWIARDLKFGAGLAGGFLVATLLFAGVTRLALYGLAAMRGYIQHYPVLRFALAGVVRRRSATIAQTSAGSRDDGDFTFDDCPNRLDCRMATYLACRCTQSFLINVQDDQKDEVQNLLRDAGFSSLTLSPMVRGRLVARNGQPLSSADYEDARAQRLIDREFNLSYSAQLPDPSQIMSGRELNPAAAEVSLENGLAKTLRLSLGDQLEFDVAGQPVHVAVTSIRRVDWDSMRANFFVIMTPLALQDAPQTWMTALHVDPGQADIIQKLVAQFHNLTVFDVGAILAQLQSILDKVSVAVQGLFVFSVLAGAIVLAAALSATRDERVHESALLRALGASRQQLARAQRIELLAVGAMAGLLAAGSASLCAWALSVWVFEFDMKFALWPWLLGVSICMLGAWLTGALTLRGVLRTPPLAILRHV